VATVIDMVLTTILRTFNGLNWRSLSPVPWGWRNSTPLARRV